MYCPRCARELTEGADEQGWFECRACDWSGTAPMDYPDTSGRSDFEDEYGYSPDEA